MPTDTERIETLAANMERVCSSRTSGSYRWPTRNGLVESDCFDCSAEDLRRFIDNLEEQDGAR